MTFIRQDSSEWYMHVPRGDIYIHNIQISDGGLLLVDGDVKVKDSITLKNISNLKGGRKYMVMLWPPGDKYHQQAVPKLRWNGGTVHQGIYEAAFRGKVDDALIQNVKFIGSLSDAGRPIKQVVQVRHGKSWVFQNCIFEDSWPDLGAQRDASLGGSYVPSQKVGVVTFIGCRFLRWNGKNVFSRQPGVSKISIQNCFSPDGKKFSKDY